MADERFDDLQPHDRRKFFRTGLSRILKPLAGYIESKLPIDLPVVADRLRPPGALAEKLFLDTCYRCGSCAESCPVDAILQTKNSDDTRNGTPYIDPKLQPCVMCDDLACMKACPSGALKRKNRFDIRIGLARVDEAVCVRSKGEDCRLCVEVCPLGEMAISITENRVRVVDPARTGQGCTGCGMCEHACPTKPKRAIRVYPY